MPCTASSLRDHVIGADAGLRRRPIVDRCHDLDEPILHRDLDSEAAERAARLHRKRRRGICEVACRVAVSQASEGDVAASRGGVGRVDGETVEHPPLLRLNFRQQGIRLGKVASAR